MQDRVGSDTLIFFILRKKQNSTTKALDDIKGKSIVDRAKAKLGTSLEKNMNVRAQVVLQGHSVHDALRGSESTVFFGCRGAHSFLQELSASSIFLLKLLEFLLFPCTFYLL